MSILPMNVQLLEGTFGITCVENQLLATLKYLNLEYRALYIYSYISYEDVFCEF